MLLQEKTKPISPDCGLGRLTRLEAMGESHVNHTVLDASRLRLTRLSNALARVKTEMLGICINCEEEIGIERMRIRPESVRCISCASQRYQRAVPSPHENHSKTHIASRLDYI